MARLTWAQKLNNRLKRNWGVEIDYSKCFTASACGKRSYYDHGTENPISDERWKRLYKALSKITRRDSLSITYNIYYDWDQENYKEAMCNESEYYGYCYGYITISIKTPTGRQKLVLDSRYV